MKSFTTDQPPFRFRQGSAPLLISMPHVGTYVPAHLLARFSDEGQRVPDTDWHLEQLYDFADELGASVLVATHSRFVIDLNRPPDGASLYPGQSVTGLCPTDLFDNSALYRNPNDLPTETEIAQRREAIWLPYHQQLANELARIKQLHGIAGLWDAHSIRSVLPRFFEGKLPDLNFGTAKGSSCDPSIGETMLSMGEKSSRYSTVLNGRFTGGYITRQYGNPAERIHAIQLEMTQSSYMEEQWPFAYSPELSSSIQPLLQAMLEKTLSIIRQL